MTIKKPDYDNLRNQEDFVWYVNSSVYALAKIADISLYELNSDYKAGIKMYQEDSINSYLENFNFNEKMRRPVISTPPVSYGHLNGIGVDLVFPLGNGEVNYEKVDRPIDEWIKMLEEPRDFKVSGMAPYFIDYMEKLKEAYPGKQVRFSYGYEGPITEAYTMLDSNFFYALYDEPEKLKIMLDRIARSVIRFKRFYSQMNNSDYLYAYGMCDDIAAMVAPDMWDEFVIPFMDIIYSDTGNYKRNLHCEDMTYKHLKNLETLGITWYDPSISPKLTPPLITNNCRIPYIFRLGSIYHSIITPQLAKDFVYASIRDGASGVFTEADHLDSHSIAVVNAFIEACENTQSLFDQGATREDIGKQISPEGKAYYWDKWLK